jgi:hypothetical protein
LTTPLITFISVVLPLPLGPMSPTIDPGRTSNETPLSAHKPPKRMPTFSMRNTPSALTPGTLRGRRDSGACRRASRSNT